MLGNGIYDIYFADRGGGVLIGQVTAQFRLKVQWVRDDIGMCSITVTSPDDDCCELLASLRTVRHEMVVFRNGERVWEGPITRIGYFADYVEIDARDVAWYLSRRLMERGFDHTGVSVDAVDTVYGVLIDHYPPAGDGGFNIGPYLTVVKGVDDARTAAKHENYSKTLFELLNTYADNGGLDFVVRGRRIVIYDTHTRFAVLPQLSDADFAQSLGVVEYGSELNTRVASSNNNGLVSLAEAPQQWLDYYGYIDHLRSNEDEGADDPLPEEEAAAKEALATQAQRELDRGYPAPVNILVPANIGVMPTVPIEFTDLMPGAWVPVASGRTCRELRQWQRIDDTTVTVDPDGEVVTITLIQAPAKFEEPLSMRVGGVAV